MTTMPNNVEFMVHFTQQTVYLMGVSFILGSLCTIFILLILDMVRRHREMQPPPPEPAYTEESRNDR